MAGTNPPSSNPEPGSAVKPPSADTELPVHDATGDDPKNAAKFDFLSPPEAADEIGRLGGYRVLSKLGEGGMGVVFLAEELALGRPVALKVMKPETNAHPQARERFLREGRAAAKVRSDHVVTIYQVGEANGLPFLAMERLDGMTLEQWLAGHGDAVSLLTVLRFAHDLCRGLAAAHEKGLVHRDIKPSNLWVEPSGRVKLLDFGLTRGQKGEDRITSAGVVVGTPAYMAPEQGGGKDIDARADLFSVGVVIYRMLTGSSPFERGDFMATLMALASETPPPLSEVVYDLPPELVELVRRLMEREPAKRPASVVVAMAALDAIERQVAESIASGATLVQDQTTDSKDAPKLPPKASPARSRATSIVAALAGVTILLVCAMMGLLLIHTPDDAVRSI